MVSPYVYVATGKSRDVSRNAPTGARVAIHYPELGRCIELHTDEHGRYWIQTGPDATHGGRWNEVARGKLHDETDGGRH